MMVASFFEPCRLERHTHLVYVSISPTPGQYLFCRFKNILSTELRR